AHAHPAALPGEPGQPGTGRRDHPPVSRWQRGQGLRPGGDPMTPTDLCFASVFDTVDVRLTPVTPRPPLRIGELFASSGLTTMLGAQRYTAYMTLWNLAGNPAAVIPAGRTDDGLPIGAQLVGRPHDESTLLALSAQCEAERHWSQLRPNLD